MDVVDKNGPSSSTAIKHPSISKGADENEESYEEMGVNVQNSKKPTTKHYMSPTISAASKANPPRKKILAERNESLDNSLQKTPASLDSKATSSTEFDDNEQNVLVDDLSSGPYDPLTNYLSPRPKFLRYKPNRRQELFLRRENQAKEGNDDGLTIVGNGSLKTEKGINSEANLASSCGSLATGFNDANVKQESELMDESEDEFEEVCEEGGWGFRGILKILVLLTVLVFSTLYISSMNSPTPPPVVQAVMGLKDGYHMIQGHIHEFVMSLESGKYLLVDREGTQMSFIDIDGIEEEEMIEDVKIGETEHSDGLNEVMEIRNGEVKVLEMVEDEEEGVVDEFREGEESADASDLGEKGIVDEVFKVQAGESADASDLEMARIGEVSNEVAANSELQGPEAVEVIQMPLTNESSVPNTLEKENEMVHEPIKEEIFDREMGGIGNITDDYDVHEVLTPNEGLIKHLETESILKAVIGFSVFSSIVAFLVLVLHFRKNRNASKDSHPVVEPCLDSVIAEKCCSLLANEEDMDKHIEHPVSFANSMSLINSLEEDSKQTYESRAPTIELLGELVVGEMSSSLRSCGVKSRMIESEVSSYSVSMEKGIGSKANSLPVRVQPALSQISKINLPSYTDEKKIVKKEEGGDGEVNKVLVTTPLRRSSRIRNRPIASP
ncbi:hypothetical protein P3X46_011068 [Hevea brasiliensis]|uniref:Uncharacterized protein n=2 Tax=Hevea brasiliensis TaxID=3981 RepID=A0ABQ9MK44_HEVBR|nr:hypothetical protein P3X46_011068 [Hevea brasiliensis]